jgi:hypothetical protein
VADGSAARVRGAWPQVARIALSAVVFAGWVALIVSEAMG